MEQDQAPRNGNQIRQWWLALEQKDKMLYDLLSSLVVVTSTLAMRLEDDGK